MASEDIKKIKGDLDLLLVFLKPTLQVTSISMASEDTMIFFKIVILISLCSYLY